VSGNVASAVNTGGSQSAILRKQTLKVTSKWRERSPISDA
jgi:hypothetical protein